MHLFIRQDSPLAALHMHGCAHPTPAVIAGNRSTQRRSTPTAAARPFYTVQLRPFNANDRLAILSEENMLLFRIIIALGLIAALPAAAVAATTSMLSMPGGGGGPQTASFFAYPGKECPGGSQLYKGPEAALAKKSGAVYCEFRKTVEVFEKKRVKKCPASICREYKDANAKPDPDVIWCEMDPNPKIPPPPPPWQDAPPPPR